MGAQINGIGTHQLIIHGQNNLKPTKHTIEPDYIEAGTFAVASALTNSQIIIKPFPYESLKPVLVVFKKMGIGWNFDEKSQSFSIVKLTNMKATTIRTDPHPGFPSDLQSPFGVLATQAQGTTLLFETLYEGRLKYLDQLRNLGASIIIADTHRALITGPTPLFGGEIESFDIRAGATMILAGLIANGKTLIKNASQIDRGYENIDQKLIALGANIKRVKL
jgi:UDP-N-acetylglucosamine 1-carboxyvinyltransferase